MGKKNGREIRKGKDWWGKMEKIYIKSLDKEIEIDSWHEANEVASQIISSYIIENNLGTKIINKEIDQDGFVIDFLVEKNISEKSLPLIEGKVKKQMQKNVATSSELPSSLIKEIKLRGISGITLKSEEKANRIFGFATLSSEEFKIKLLEIEEREQRDHRKIGESLDLFYIDQTIGKGLPIWLPNGVILKKQIKDYIWKQEEKYGSLQIETPSLGTIDLYKISGHYNHYKENMFPEMKIEENETFMLRPMACPHHVMVYKRKPRSYKELPFRISENVKQYRYEHSGSLIGLERVRAMELTDSHIFLMENQLESELERGFNLIEETLNKFNIKIDYIELALHDPENLDKYHGDNSLWKKSEKILKTFLQKKKIEFIEMKGEAAFYGPKIDVQIKTALGHQVTVSTIQLDFLLPEKFELSYTDKNLQKIKPIMIHRGLIGTYERFISILLEQTKGNLPMWLSPVQSVIIPINNAAHLTYAKELFNYLKENGIRTKLDDGEDRLSNKIRIHQSSKVKVQIIIGDEEIQGNFISYRFYGSEKVLKIDKKQILDVFNE